LLRCGIIGAIGLGVGEIQGADLFSSGAQKLIQLSLEVSRPSAEDFVKLKLRLFGVIDEDAFIGPHVMPDDGGAFEIVVDLIVAGIPSS
jgi:hypothetical protein